MNKLEKITWYNYFIILKLVLFFLVKMIKSEDHITELFRFTRVDNLIRKRARNCKKKKKDIFQI